MLNICIYYQVELNLSVVYRSPKYKRCKVPDNLLLVEMNVDMNITIPLNPKVES